MLKIITEYRCNMKKKTIIKIKKILKKELKHKMFLER